MITCWAKHIMYAQSRLIPSWAGSLSDAGLTFIDMATRRVEHSATQQPLAHVKQGNAYLRTHLSHTSIV